MKKLDKEINTKYFSLLITNYLSLGFSIVKTPPSFYFPNTWFHVNLWTCQIQFYKKNKN